MVDKLPYRVKFARKMGATKAFLFDEAKVGVKIITKNVGTSYVFDTGGTNDSISLCLEVIAAAGTLAFVGIPSKDEIEINPHVLRIKEITIKNVRRSNQTLEKCIKLFSEDKEAEKMITHTFKFEDIQKAFYLVSKYNDGVVKCVVKDY